MKKNVRNIALLLGLMPALVLCQRIDNTAAYRTPNSSSYTRILYDNDFFSATDKYYTQGYTIEWVSPVLRKNPLNKALVGFKNGTTQYGVAFDHFGFTPTSIESNEILVGDRPFAAFLALKTFSMSLDTAKKARISSALSLGMIGPVAFAEGMQRGIHKLMNGIDPRGWQFQIQNDVAITYEINYEKQIFAHPEFFSLNTNAQLRVGTINNKVSTGFTAMVGLVQPPFAARKPKTFQFYFYAQPLVSLVGYDATLQGGLFGRSPYSLNAGQVRRATFQANAGLVLQYKKLYLEYTQSYISQEFVGGKNHRWGGLRVGFLM